ncbi:MAG: hypothetical protein ACI379_17300 [Nocardioides sp.]|uniref:hypothetical protein n=1 Tax=Nocardioides sp. TaxID=35761 RepID=UPI003F0F8166
MPAPRHVDPSPGTPRRLLPRRRVALTGGLLAVGSTVGLGGCWIDPDAPATTGTTPTRPTSTHGSDLEVVRSVVAQIDDVRTQISALGAPLPASVTALLAIHDAHREVLVAALGDDGETQTAAPEVSGAPATPSAASMSRLRRSEARLQRELTAATGQVSSGDLARVLASATAGVAQGASLLGGEAAQ